ncbi:nucleoside hydrolase, partial [Klebsiella pneumoniae]
WLRGQGDLEPTYLSCGPLATAIVIDTDIVQNVDTVYATVEVEGEYTRAQMVVDWWGFRRKSPNVDIIRSLNMSRYKSLLMTAM